MSREPEVLSVYTALVSLVKREVAISEKEAIMRRQIKYRSYEAFEFGATAIAACTAMKELSEGRSAPPVVAGYRLVRRPSGLAVASKPTGG